MRPPRPRTGMLLLLWGTTLAAQDAARPEPGTLSPGDSLRILVWREPELSGTFAVGADGTLVHPLYRAVAVAGLPLAEVERRTLAFLGTLEQQPQIALEPLYRVVVAGEVRAPGVRFFGPGASVAHAVATAGGTTERAREGDVRLVRAGERRTVDLRDPRDGAETLPVRSGDVITVPRKGMTGSTIFGIIVSLTSLTASVLAIASLSD